MSPLPKNRSISSNATTFRLAVAVASHDAAAMVQSRWWGVEVHIFDLRPTPRSTSSLAAVPRSAGGGVHLTMAIPDVTASLPMTIGRACGPLRKSPGAWSEGAHKLHVATSIRSAGSIHGMDGSVDAAAASRTASAQRTAQLRLENSAAWTGTPASRSEPSRTYPARPPDNQEKRAVNANSGEPGRRSSIPAEWILLEILEVGVVVFDGLRWGRRHDSSGALYERGDRVGVGIAENISHRFVQLRLLVE